MFHNVLESCVSDNGCRTLRKSRCIDLLCLLFRIGLRLAHDAIKSIATSWVEVNKKNSSVSIILGTVDGLGSSLYALIGTYKRVGDKRA
jgi:hypothetical protein